jgi:CP family cyanate transporter-like MFS transporter
MAFPLAVTLMVLRSRDARDAAQLSAMSFSVGYLLAAVGPTVFGALHDVSNGWTIPLVFLVMLLAPQALAGHRAGQPGRVRDHTSSSG